MTSSLDTTGTVERYAVQAVPACNSRATHAKRLPRNMRQISWLPRWLEHPFGKTIADVHPHHPPVLLDETHHFTDRATASARPEPEAAAASGFQGTRILES